MVKLREDFAFVQDFGALRAISLLDGHKLERFLLAGFVNNGVLAAAFLLADVVVVHLNLSMG